MAYQTKFGDLVLTNVGERRAKGDKAPDAVLMNKDLKEVKLSDWDGKIKVLAVVPSMDTGVCQAQVRRFNEEATKLGDDVVVLAISMDLPFAQQRFCAAEGLDQVITLSDHRDADFGENYGFLMKELRLLSRGVVIVDRDNVIQYTEYVPEVPQQVDFDAALAALKEIV